jgi:hypothetical protein
MVVVLHAEAAGLGNGLQLVVWQGRKLATGDTKRVKELIVRIVHLITAEHSFQATLVKRLVMSHQWQTLYQRLYLCPHFREYRSIFGIFPAKSVNL